MSGQSTTLVYALARDIAARLGDALLDADRGPDKDPIGLYPASCNSAIETSPRPLIRTAGVSGLGHLESLGD